MNIWVPVNRTKEIKIYYEFDNLEQININQKIIEIKLMMKDRRNRRVSTNQFKKYCDIKPFIKQEEEQLTGFQISLMLMQILKKQEKFLFLHKEAELQTIINHVVKQNEVLEKIKYHMNRKKEKALVSSFKVLQELDVNRIEAFRALGQENKQLSDKIYGLQTALTRIKHSKKAASLSLQYLNETSERVGKYRKNISRLKGMIEKIEEEYQQMLSSKKGEVLELVEHRWKKIERNKISEKGSVKQILVNSKINDLIQEIFFQLDF